MSAITAGHSQVPTSLCHKPPKPILKVFDLPSSSSFSLRACSTTYFRVRLNDILLVLCGLECVWIEWVVLRTNTSPTRVAKALIPLDVPSLTLLQDSKKD